MLTLIAFCLVEILLVTVTIMSFSHRFRAFFNIAQYRGIQFILILFAEAVFGLALSNSTVVSTGLLPLPWRTLLLGSAILLFAGTLLLYALYTLHGNRHPS